MECTKLSQLLIPLRTPCAPLRRRRVVCLLLLRLSQPARMGQRRRKCPTWNRMSRRALCSRRRCPIVRSRRMWLRMWRVLLYLRSQRFPSPRQRNHALGRFGGHSFFTGRSFQPPGIERPPLHDIRKLGCGLGANQCAAAPWQSRRQTLVPSRLFRNGQTMRQPTRLRWGQRAASRLRGKGGRRRPRH